MTLDELIKIIEEGTPICIRMNYFNENAAIDYYFLPKEILPKEWYEYRVISINTRTTRGGIVIDVEEVANND